MGMKEIAVFDFDETIISRDTLINYIRFIPGRNRIRALAGGILYRLMKILETSLTVRKYILSAMIWTGTVGLGRVGLNKRTGEFIDYFFSGPDSVKVYANALERLSWHTARNHSVVILSASTERLIRLVMDRVSPTIPCQIIGSTEKCFLGGTVLKDYCSGSAKIPLAYQAGLPKKQWEYAYSDSSRDLPILLHSKERFLINPTEETVAEAKQVLGEGFEILQWR